MQAVFEQNLIHESVIDRADTSFGKKVGIFTMLFGCRHKDLSRPFTSGRMSYRACTECGARKNFDAQSLKTSGPFYFPPSAASERS